MSSSSDKPPVRLCAQRKTTGDPCKTPALSDSLYCHFHKVMGPSPIQMSTFEENPYKHHYLPLLKDAASIQSAISEVCELMLHRRIEPKEASALFYAMQVASTNLGGVNVNRNQKPNSETPSETISEDSSGESSPASPEPNPLPPGTIQACAPPKRRHRRLPA